MLVSKSDRAYASLAELLASARQKLAGFAKHNEGELFAGSQSLGFLYTYIAVLCVSACAWLGVFFLRGDLRLWAIGLALLFSLLSWILSKLEKRAERRANAAAAGLARLEGSGCLGSGAPEPPPRTCRRW